MTEFQGKLHELNSCIENAKKEKLNLMINKYREPLNASLLNTLFLNEKLSIVSKDLFDTLEDLKISLYSINKLIDDECLSKQEVTFRENNVIIENSIDQQMVILNKYISDMQLMLSSGKEEN